MDIIDLHCRSERHLDRHFSGAKQKAVKAEDKPPAHATYKELEILAALCELRFGCVTRLRRYTGRGERSVQRSLSSLRDKRLVAWFRWIDTTNATDGMDPLTTIPVYSLTEKGVERCMLDRVVESDEYLLTRSWRGKPSIPSTMPHQLGIADIMSGFRKASRKSSLYEIDLMVPDFVSEEVEGQPRIATVEMVGTDNELRPDLTSRARSKISGENFTFYIELERKSRNAKKIIGKFNNYSALFRSGERRFNFGKPVLLYVVQNLKKDVDTVERIKLVRSWVREKAVAPAFRIAALNDVKEDAFGTVWQKHDGTKWGIGN